MEDIDVNLTEMIIDLRLTGFVAECTYMAVAPIRSGHRTVFSLSVTASHY